MAMKTPEQQPQLAELAQACWGGACNVYALIIALGNAVKESDPSECRDHPAVKVIVGQISYLLNESPGATSDAYVAWEEWKKS